MHKILRVLIADNNLEYLEQFQAYLERQQDITVVSTVRDGHGAVKACREIMPDLAVIDLHLPVLDSVRAIKSIIAENEHIRILGISAVANDRYALEAVKAGALGYVKKNGPAGFGQITQAIRQLASGEVIIDPNLAASILQEFSRDYGDGFAGDQPVNLFFSK
ncbi:MAG: hypothetical protein Kow0031_41920 [Anaerolineae bacterium]